MVNLPAAGDLPGTARGAGLNASFQQKRLKQRQLALKRKHDLSRNALGAVAQNDVPLAGASAQKKVTGWGKFLLDLGRPGAQADAKSSMAEPAIVKISTAETVASPAAAALNGEVPLPAAPDTVAPCGEQPQPHQQPSDVVSVSGASEVSEVPAVVGAGSPLPRGELQRGWDLQLRAEAAEGVKESTRQRGRFWPPFASRSKGNSSSGASRTVLEEPTCISLLDGEVAEDPFDGSRNIRSGTGKKVVHIHGTLDASFNANSAPLPGAVNVEDMECSANDAILPQRPPTRQSSGPAEKAKVCERSGDVVIESPSSTSSERRSSNLRGSRFKRWMSPKATSDDVVSTFSLE